MKLFAQPKIRLGKVTASRARGDGTLPLKGIVPRFVGLLPRAHGGMEQQFLL